MSVALGSLRVGQVPKDPLTIAVAGVTDLAAAYPGGVDVRMVDPLGATVTLNETVSVAGNVVTMPWGDTSPFATPGDYTVQLALDDGAGAFDLTTPAVIEVYRRETP